MGLSEQQLSEMSEEEIIHLLRVQVERVAEILNGELPWEHPEARAQVARIRRRLARRDQLQTEEERNGNVREVSDGSP